MLLGGVLVFVLAGQQSGSTPQGGLAANQVSAASQEANPLDQLSSADIAVNIARMSALPETTAVVNQADSVNAELATMPAGASIVSKPQVVATGLKSRKDIQHYVTRPGDTIASIAAKLGVTSDSVRWSNGLSGDSVKTGQNLVIPPVGMNGIVYTVRSGDTADSLAQKFNAGKDQIIASNDAEIAGLPVGEQIIIPGGSQPAPVASYSARSYSSSGFAWGSAPIYGHNGYDYGFCTWYVANKISMPANWGDANTWDNRAAVSGWVVSAVPEAGAIAQSDRGSQGHVAYVEAVSPDGSQIKYSDMNGLAGWGRVGYSGWTPASHFEHYIYR